MGTNTRVTAATTRKSMRQQLTANNGDKNKGDRSNNQAVNETTIDGKQRARKQQREIVVQQRAQFWKSERSNTTGAQWQPLHTCSTRRFHGPSRSSRGPQGCPAGSSCQSPMAPSTPRCNTNRTKDTRHGQARHAGAEIREEQHTATQKGQRTQA